MRNRTVSLVAIFSIITGVFVACETQHEAKDDGMDKEKVIAEFKKTNGYPSIEKYGEHLVTIGGCNDCHSPKKMGPHGPEVDSFKLLSGHPANLPAPDVDRKAMQAKGLVVTNDLTAWVGPWGVSFTANLTPDDTGLGAWKVEQFMTAIRHGKFHGQENGRSLLPPMPWDMYRQMSDEELAAVFAYLKSIKAVENLVPAPLPPM